jgi:predicted flap endonuclease-1-like 5' DNA nuclease
MENYYLVIILAVVALLAVLGFVLARRARALPPGEADAVAPVQEPDVSVLAAEGLVDPILSVPPEAIGGIRTPPMDVSPTATEPAPEIVPEAHSSDPGVAGPPDPLTTLKGLGPKAAARLGALGITRYEQLAALSGDRLTAIDEQMGTFQGRIVRDRWVEQASHLAAGDIAGFEAKFGKLGG